jgi:rRNA-processing protein FCF1
MIYRRGSVVKIRCGRGFSSRSLGVLEVCLAVTSPVIKKLHKLLSKKKKETKVMVMIAQNDVKSKRAIERVGHD